MITCEHGGNRVPAPYRDLFRSEQALLDSHRGYDPGALLMTRTLAKAFSAPLVTATVSRLLVDLNRSEGHRHLHSEPVQQLQLGVRERILQQFYRPYRERVEHLITRSIAETGRVIHIASHTFVPELDGKPRRADIGLLYDPARPGELELCSSWQARLRLLAPEVTVRRNYPYAGKSDGLTAWFRRQFSAGEYVGIELEVNQTHAARTGNQWRRLRKLIVESLHGALEAWAPCSG